MAFYVGQKVECVNNGPLLNRAGEVFAAPQLTHGGIYHVKSVWPDGRVFLVEAEALYGCIGFNEHRFRPIVERKTSIEIFQRMLNPASQREDAA